MGYCRQSSRTHPSYFRKRLVAQNRQYDFLDDLVESVADPTAGGECGISGESKPNGKSKGRGNGAKASPALKPNASTPPTSAAVASPADSGARAPTISSVMGVISGPVGIGPITTTQPTAYGSGKGPSNASIILNSPTAPVMGGSSVKTAAKPEHDFDNYDEEDDEDDDYDA